MKMVNRLKLMGIAKLLSLFIPLIILISIVFPTYSIFDYQHSVLSSTDPELYISVTEKPLFVVISDNNYSVLLKAGYISLFVVEILSAICCLACLSVFIFGKKRVGEWLFNISNSFLIILSIFVISLFYANPLILGILLICLLISIGSAVLRIVIKIKKGEEIEYLPSEEAYETYRNIFVIDISDLKLRHFELRNLKRKRGTKKDPFRSPLKAITFYLLNRTEMPQCSIFFEEIGDFCYIGASYLADRKKS